MKHQPTSAGQRASLDSAKHAAKTHQAGRFKPSLMRNALLCGIALLSSGAAALAEEEPPLGQITPNIRVLGEMRARYEGYDFFQPTNTGGRVRNNQNDYSFGSIRARLGVNVTTDWLDAFAQAQYIGIYALPEHAFSSAGPLGLGASYYRDSGNQVNPNEVFLKQGYLNFKLQ